MYPSGCERIRVKKKKNANFSASNGEELFGNQIHSIYKCILLLNEAINCLYVHAAPVQLSDSNRWEEIILHKYLFEARFAKFANRERQTTHSRHQLRSFIARDELFLARLIYANKNSPFKSTSLTISFEPSGNNWGQKHRETQNYQDTLCERMSRMRIRWNLPSNKKPKETKRKSVRMWRRTPTD